MKGGYDIVIAGAGPAGLSLARELADSGLKILVLDKKKSAEDAQYNTLGSLIEPKEWGLPSNILHPVNTLYFASKNQVAIKSVPVNSVNSVNRKKLLSFLERDAKRRGNVKVAYEALIDGVELDAGVKSIQYTSKGKKKMVKAKIFADCSGVGVVIGGKLGLVPRNPVTAVGIEYIVPLKTEPNTIDLFVGSHFRGGYGWILPINSKKAIVGYGTLDKELFKDVQQLIDEMWNIPRVKERCEFKPLKKEVAVLRTGKPLKKFTQGNVVVVGDSALQVNPILGEGVRFVMDASRMAAKWIKAAIKKGDISLLENYSREWRKKYCKKYELGFKLQELAKKHSKSDGNMDLGVRFLRKNSSKDLYRLISGDISYPFLAKIMGKALIKKLAKI